MLNEEIRSLVTGDELFLLDGIGNKNPANVVTFVSGPHEDGMGVRRKWVALVRLKDGKLGLYNTSDLAVKPPKPEEGETWVRHSDMRHRYIAGVTKSFVILKGSAGQHNSRAHAMPMNDFLASYRKMR
jgi:hypothetical protein